MNHLAHFILSGTDQDIIIGNFITDYIRKSDVKDYSFAIQKGISRHRRIDSFTDGHALVKSANKRMRPLQQKYTPVVMDVCFDHLLARNWSTFSDISLREYADYIYEILIDRKSDLPERLQASIKGMIEGDWLYSFRSKKGLAYTFSLLKRRLKFDNRIEAAADDLYKEYDFYNLTFLSFFKELQAEIMD